MKKWIFVLAAILCLSSCAQANSVSTKTFDEEQKGKQEQVKEQAKKLEEQDKIIQEKEAYIKTLEEKIQQLEKTKACEKNENKPVLSKEEVKKLIQSARDFYWMYFAYESLSYSSNSPASILKKIEGHSDEWYYVYPMEQLRNELGEFFSTQVTEKIIEKHVAKNFAHAVNYIDIEGELFTRGGGKGMPTNKSLVWDELKMDVYSLDQKHIICKIDIPIDKLIEMDGSDVFDKKRIKGIDYIDLLWTNNSWKINNTNNMILQRFPLAY